MSHIIINHGLDNEIMIPMADFFEGSMRSIKRKTRKEIFRDELIKLKETADNNLKVYREMMDLT